jgi:hypothetical protein
MAYSDWMQKLNSLWQNDENEKQRFLERISNSTLPSFDSNASVDAAMAAKEKMAQMLASHSGTPIDSQLDAGGMATASRLSKIADDLANAETMYGARSVDIGRGMQRNQDIFTNNLDKLGMANTMLSNQRARGTNAYINEITRQSNYKNIQENYRRQIEQLKQQAEYERKRGNMAGWAAALGAIGTILGSITTFGSPVGAIVGGSIGNAAGNILG